MKAKIVLFLLMSLVGNSFAQNLNLKKRYSFAKTYVGLDVNYLPNLPNSFFLNDLGTISPFERASFLTPAINIGATHFWGHADFFVSITTSPRKFGTDELGNSIDLGAITGMRIFPWKLKDHTVRPYLGYKFAPIRFNQEDIDQSPYRKTQVKSLLGLGLAYRSPKMYTYLGYDLIPNSSTEIFLSRTVSAESNFPKRALSLGINYMLETTNGSYTKPIAQLDSMVRAKNVLGFFFGVGPSAAFPLKKSSYIRELRPYLDDRSMPNIFPEITLGYHFSKQEFALSAAFRPIRQQRTAFDFDQQIQRNSFSLEAYKFLLDYHGFAPFIGVGVVHDLMRLKESDAGINITDEKYSKTSPSLIFGWDIRPSRRADIWLLRTNLRYSPLSEIERTGKMLSLQHLEFNFIQAVIYPQKIRKYKELIR